MKKAKTIEEVCGAAPGSFLASIEKEKKFLERMEKERMDRIREVLKKKKFCLCCGRQFVSWNCDLEKTVQSDGAVALVGGFACKECAKDIDEDGFFPDEQK